MRSWPTLLHMGEEQGRKVSFCFFGGLPVVLSPIIFLAQLFSDCLKKFQYCGSEMNVTGCPVSREQISL